MVWFFTTFALLASPLVIFRWFVVLVQIHGVFCQVGPGLLQILGACLFLPCLCGTGLLLSALPLVRVVPGVASASHVHLLKATFPATTTIASASTPVRVAQDRLLVGLVPVPVHSSPALAGILTLPLVGTRVLPFFMELPRGRLSHVLFTFTLRATSATG